MSLLEVNQIAVSFGGVHAVQDVTFAVDAGEVFSIVGPNGAGKTTIFNLISRLYDSTHGSLAFDGADFTQMPAHEVARLGIARTFQNTELFEQESVLNNLLIGCHVRRTTGWWQDLFFTPACRRQALDFRKDAEEVIDLLNLQSYRDQPIGSLAYGVRKMVEVARALCIKPKLLLLDEPSSGLNPEETEDLSFWIEDINEELGITVLMVEHDMNLVAQVSNRVLALADGRQLALGDPASVQNDPEVKRAYLGD